MVSSVVVVDESKSVLILESVGICSPHMASRPRLAILVQSLNLEILLTAQM